MTSALTNCIGHARFSPKDIERLEARVATLKETNDFEDENHAYIEAATHIASEAADHKESILAALDKEDKKAQAKRDQLNLVTFDNVPDLAHAIAKENGLPPAIADAYVRMKEEGQDSRTVARELGVAKSSLNDWMAKFEPMVHEASKLRLFKKTREETVEPEEKPGEVVAPEERAQEEQPTHEAEAEHEEPKKEGEEGEEEAHPDEGGALVAGDLRESGDLADEANHNPYDAGEERTDTDSNINISSNPYGEGNTGVKDSLPKERKEALAKRWEQFNKGIPVDKQVKFSDLGEAQQRAFDAEMKKSADRTSEAQDAFNAEMKEIKKSTDPTDRAERTRKAERALNEAKIKSAERTRRAHRELSELRSQGIAYNKLAGWTVIEGNDDQPKPQLGKMMSSIKDALAKSTMFQSIEKWFSSKEISVKVGGEDLKYSSLNSQSATPVHHAIAELTGHPEAGPFFSKVLTDFLHGVFLFRTAKETEAYSKTGGFFDSQNRVVAINMMTDQYLDAALSQDRVAQTRVSRIVAHELSHGADRAASVFAGHTEPGDMFSASPESRLFVALDTGEVGEFQLHEGTGDVVREAIDWFSEADRDDAAKKLLEEYLSYPMDPLFAAGFFGDKGSAASIKRAERQASVELLPRLVELRLNYPDVLKEQLPLGYELADRFIRSTSEAEIVQSLRKENYVSDEHGETGRPAEGVSKSGAPDADLSGKVRPDAGEGLSGVGEVFRDATSASPEDRRSERAPAAEAAGGDNRRLIVSPEEARARTVTDVKRWTNTQGHPSEPINPKVQPLVSALNDRGIVTTLSGDLYGNSLVYVDLRIPRGTISQSDLPAGWKVGSTLYKDTEARLGIGESRDLSPAGQRRLINEMAMQFKMTPVQARAELDVQTRISRLGGKISAEEAAKVASAVEQAILAREAKPKDSHIHFDVSEGGGKKPPPELPRLDTSGGPQRFVRSIVGDKLYRNFPQILGAFSVEQLADRFKEHPAVAAFSDAVQRMGALANKLLGAAQPIIREWHDAKRMFGADKDRAFGDFLIHQTRAGMWAKKDFEDAAHDYLKPPAPKDDATQAEKDAHEQMLAPLRAKHEELKKEYAALPEAYKRLVDRVEQINRDNFQQHIAADKAAIIKSFYPGLEDDPRAPRKDLVDQAAAITGKVERRKFMEAQTDELVRNRVSDMWEALDDHQEDYKKGLAGPYFPLQRFGDHIVSYKSPEYRAAEAAYDAAKKLYSDTRVGDIAKERTDSLMEIDRLRKKLGRVQDKTETAKRLEEAEVEAKELSEQFESELSSSHAAMAAAREKVNDLKSDPGHYNVEFYENRALAIQREAQLREHFKNDDMEVKRALRDQYFGEIDKTTPSYVNRIADHLSGALEGADREAVRRTVREMYVLNLPGSHSLKSMLKRRNVPGVKGEEALRAFATKATKDAFAISRKLHMPDMTEHTNALRYGDNTNEDAKLLGAELAKRMVLNARMSTNKAINYATNWTYFTQLGLSPGFMLQQGTQQWINTAPIFAARHGVRTATSELAKGTGDAAKLLKVSIDKSSTKMTFKVDLAEGVKKGLITEGEQAMLQNMFDHGRIDIASAHDAFIASQGADPTIINRAAQMANWPVQQLEVINRISTALGAYRAEMRKLTRDGTDSLKAEQQAQKYADRLVSETHMNYASENRARFIHPNSWGGWGRIMFQFRAYQQGMAYLTAKNIVDGLRGDKEARKAAMYMAGVQIATGGLSALPVPAAVTIAAKLLYNAFTADDDQKDLKEMLYEGLKSIGGETFATAAVKGVPAALGADVSAKIGAGNTYDLVPFMPPGKEGKDLVASAFFGLVGGPAMGDIGGYGEAISQASKGNYVKALTMMSPKAVADLLKAEEFQRVGMKDSHGNTILHPDEISVGDSALRAMGLQPADLGRVQDARSAFYTAKRNRDQARQKLLTEYATAKLEGGDAGSVMESIHEFNSRHPDARIAPGALPVAVQKRREFERNLRSGVPVGKRDRQLYQEVLGE